MYLHMGIGRKNITRIKRVRQGRLGTCLHLLVLALPEKASCRGIGAGGDVSVLYPGEGQRRALCTIYRGMNRDAWIKSANKPAFNNAPSSFT